MSDYLDELATGVLDDLDTWYDEYRAASATAIIEAHAVGHVPRANDAALDAFASELGKIEVARAQLHLLRVKWRARRDLPREWFNAGMVELAEVEYEMAKTRFEYEEATRIIHASRRGQVTT